MNASPSLTKTQHPPFNGHGKLVNLTGLAEATGLPSETLRSAYRRSLIDGIKLGHRTLFFEPSRVIAQLTALAAKKRK
jgi:hypothetical protein